jgi:5-methylcytosine-specific restriction endonuclease McrA
VESSTCMFDVLRQLGLPAVGGNSKTIQTLITINQIDTTHFNIREARRRNKTTWSVDAVLCEHSKYPRSNLARWVESANIFVYKCALCNNTGTWNGTILRLELDHINGISNDNRKENLRWLCPNCHSQTETFGGKNK